MKRALKLAALGLAGLLILSLALAIAPYFLLSGIRESHISANVPDQTQFSVILTRDLNSYFSQKLGSQADVKYQLLRDQPTQSGVAFPKFYAWVTVALLPSERKIEEGAVRLAAREQAGDPWTPTLYTDALRCLGDASASSGSQCWDKAGVRQRATRRTGGYATVLVRRSIQ
jgi:hypothetical protein